MEVVDKFSCACFLCFRADDTKICYFLIVSGIKGFQHKRSQMMMTFIHHKQGGHNYLKEGHAQNGIQGTLTQRSMECEIARSKPDGSKQVYGLIYTLKIKVEDSEAKGSHLKENS